MSLLPREGAIPTQEEGGALQRSGGEAQGPAVWSLGPKVLGPACPTIWLDYLALGPITDIKGRLDSAAVLRNLAPLYNNESLEGPAIGDGCSNCALEKKNIWTTVKGM